MVLTFQVVAAGANPVLITRGIEKTAKALVSELKLMSKEVMESAFANGFNYCWVEFQHKYCCKVHHFG